MNHSDEIMRTNLEVPVNMRGIYRKVCEAFIEDPDPAIPPIIGGQQLPFGLRCLGISDREDRRIILASEGLSEDEAVDLIAAAIRGERKDGLEYGKMADLSDSGTSVSCYLCYELTDIVCELLGTECPNIIFADDPEQTYAAHAEDGKITGIVARMYEEGIGLTMLFVFTCIRRIWQYQYHYKEFYENQTYRAGDDGEAYEMQTSQLDAKAFAVAAAHQIFRMPYTVPLTGYESANLEIKKRAKKLRLEMPEIGKLPNLLDDEG